VPHSAAPPRTTRRVGATCAIFLFAVTTVQGQPPSKDPRDVRDARDETQSEIEMRQRLDPLVPAVRAALEGDNADAQRAALVLAGEFPPVMAVQVRLPDTLAKFLLRDKISPELAALGLRSFGRMFRDDPDLQRPGGPVAPPGRELDRVVGRYVKSESAEVREAAAEALATSVQNSSPSRKSVANARYFIDVSAFALPLLTELIGSKDEPAQRAALVGVQNATHTVTDIYTRGPAALGEDLPKEPGGPFAPMQPVLRGLAAVTPRLAVPLSAREADTRLAAARTVETIAVTRRVIMDNRPAGQPAAGDPFPDAWKTLRPALAERLHDESPMVRQAVTEALESLGDALEARELLRQAASDRVVFVRWAAARALGRSAPPKPTPAAVADDVAALTRLTADPDPDVRTAALVALGRFGTAAESATPAVLTAAGRGDVEPRVAAIKALPALGTDADRTVPVLISALQNPDLRLRRVAAAGLIRFGPDAKAALPELRQAATSPDPELRLNAAEAILSLERKSRRKEL
jgi:HEAT repeat protein